jgi:chitodextrinase
MLSIKPSAALSSMISPLFTLATRGRWHFMCFLGGVLVATTSIAGAADAKDTVPPSAPGPITAVSASATGVTVSWGASTDNVKVVGYEIRWDGSLVGHGAATSYSAAGLACGGSYTIAVAAFDRAGNRSQATSAIVATTPCTDSEAPSAPAGLSQSANTATSITAVWNAAADNVGVTAYGVYVNRGSVGTTSALSYVVNGLSCGRTYTIDVDAADAAGNRSPHASALMSTSPCGSAPQPPTPPALPALPAPPAPPAPPTPPGPGGGSAALFVAPNGSDAGVCVRVAPCASWNRAYGLARPGQVVEVAGGRYPGQLLQSRAALKNLSPGCAPGSTTNCVVFRPAAGQTVTIDGRLEVRGSSVWVDGTASPASGVPSRSRSFNLRVNGYVDTEANSVSDHPDQVIFEGIDAVNFGAFNVDTVTFKDMDVGPATISSGCAIKEGPGFENKIGFGGGVTYVPRNVTLDGLLIHNQNGDAGRIASDCHFGGLFLVTVDGLTIRNSVFSQNVVYNIQVQNFVGPAPTNVTLENNWFGCSVQWQYVSETTCAGQADVQFSAASRFSNWLIRYNSFAGGLAQYLPGASYQNIRVLGNAGSRPSSCYPGMTFAYNAWAGSGCAASDRNVRRLPFVSTTAGNEDFRLSPGVGARALVPPDSRDLQLAVDMIGRMRPLRFPRDAGALERDTALLRLGRSIGSVAIGMHRADVLAQHGAPYRSRSVKLGPLAASGRTDSFAVPAGALRVTTIADRVVGLSTGSRYYTTSKGLGIGTRLAVSSNSARPGMDCANVIRRRFGSVVVSFTTRRDGRIRAISMIRRGLEGRCLSGPSR